MLYFSGNNGKRNANMFDVDTVIVEPHGTLAKEWLGAMTEQEA